MEQKDIRNQGIDRTHHQNRSVHHRPNPNHKRPMRKPVKRPKPIKEKRPINKEKVFNILMLVFAGLAHIAFILIIIWSVKFSGIEIKTFVFLYVTLALLLIINDIILFVGCKFKDFIIKCVATGLSILLLIGGIFGSSIVGRISNTAGKVIENTGKEQYETVSASFVTYDNASISSLKDLSNKKVGVIKTTTENEDSTSVGKKKIETEGINVTYVEFDTLADTFMGLVGGEVDAAILPSSYKALLETNNSFTESLSKTNVIDSVEEKVKTGESTSYNKNLITEPFTVLLIGYAQESENYGLADSVILCSVNPLTYQVAMVSLARDSYVPICGGGSDKLTHARGQSRACLIQTVEDLMDEKVDFYMEINFQGVVDVVDALGGIVINNPVEFVGQSPSLERGNMTVWVPEGEFRANGEQALAFARERHAFAAGDFARQEHQQQVIKAIAEELFNLNDVNKALDVMEAAGKNFTTNFSIEQLTSLFNYILSNGKNTGVSTMNQIQMFNSRVTGYSSWHWNESAQLALWIYRLWNGSIKDNKWLIDMVMGKEDVKAQFYKCTFLHKAPYEESYSFPDTYNEEQIHEQLPTTVPNLVGMTLDEAQSWANGAGVSLGVSYVDTSDSTLVGKVKSQSVESGTPLDDCGHYVSIEVYGTNTSGIIIPTFGSADEVQAWANNNGVNFATATTPTKDKSLDGLYAGTSPGAGETVSKGGTITALVYKYSKDPEPEPSEDETLCTLTGGTWNGSSCACPSGTSWSSGEGCKEQTHDHNWVDKGKVSDANCVIGEVHRYECSCGATKDEEVPETKVQCQDNETCNVNTGACEVNTEPEQQTKTLFGLIKKYTRQIFFSNYKTSISKYNNKNRIW